MRRAAAQIHVARLEKDGVTMAMYPLPDPDSNPGGNTSRFLYRRGCVRPCCRPSQLAFQVCCNYTVHAIQIYHKYITHMTLNRRAVGLLVLLALCSRALASAPAQSEKVRRRLRARASITGHTTS